MKPPAIPGSGRERARGLWPRAVFRAAASSGGPPGSSVISRIRPPEASRNTSEHVRCWPRPLASCSTFDGVFAPTPLRSAEVTRWQEGDVPAAGTERERLVEVVLDADCFEDPPPHAARMIDARAVPTAGETLIGTRPSRASADA